jgi:subtilisin family serine protease
MGLFKERKIGLVPVVRINKLNVTNERWYEKIIDYTAIWELTKKINPAKVWLLDDTAVVTHPDLKPAVHEIYEFTNQNFESGHHGHHTAGIVASVILGINKNIKIGFAKVLGHASGQGEFGWIANGIRKGKELGYQIQSASIGSDYADSDIKSALTDFLLNPKCFFIAAAGNDAKETDYPAAWAKEFKNLIAVGAIEQDGNFKLKIADYSSSGVVTVVMPGSDILSCFPNGNNYNLSGTSMATPFVTALISLCKGINPEFNADTFLYLVKKHSVSIHDDNLKDGYGFPNIVEILKELKTMKINPVNQTPKKKRRFLWWQCTFL